MSEVLAKPIVLSAYGWFRAARILFLLFLCILPFESVTAVREIALSASALFLGISLYLGGDFHFRPTPLAVPWVLYVAAAGVSLLSAVDPGYSASELRAEVIKAALAFYLAVHLLRRPEHLHQAWAALLAGALVMALSGLLFFFMYGGSPFNYAVRAESLSAGFPEFGTYLVTVWPFALLGLRTAPAGWPRRAVAALLVLLAGSAYLTFGRATWGAMLFQTALIGLILSRHRWRAALTGGAVALLTAALMLAFLPGARHGEKWANLMTDPGKVGGTAGDLMDVWTFSLGKAAERPFAGIGLGRHSFNKAFPAFRETHQPLLWHAHNMFLDATLQMGVQGLAALLLIMAVLSASLWPKEPPEPDDAPGCFMAAALVMVAGFCLRNLSDDLFADEASLLFFTLAGLAMGARVAWPRQIK